MHHPKKYPLKLVIKNGHTVIPLNHDYLVNDDLPNILIIFTNIVGTVEIEMSFVGFTPTGPQNAFIQHDMSWIHFGVHKLQ
jgi:hypothetical protein